MAQQQPPPGSIPLQPGQQLPPGAIPVQLPPGQTQLTPEQAQQIQAQIAAEAQKRGMTPQQFIEQIRQQQQAMMQQAQQRQAQMAAQQQGGGGGIGGGGEGGEAGAEGQQQQQQQQQAQIQQQGAQPGQQVPIQPGPPKPEALALAAFLRSQDLKLRTCIFQEKRKDMFRVKRAIRALHSDAYAKARSKNPLLPPVTDRVSAENTFKLLPMSFLALRVQKADAHAGHAHAPAKRTKGLWTVAVVPQQEAHDDFYYVWLYEGSQWKNQLYAAGALLLILAVVFFPVWPYPLRLGVWYLSMGMLGLLGLFFAMAIFRLILFVVTMFTAPPGLWLYPNLFEDVGFFDSFKPLWAWHEDEKAVKKRKKEERDRKRARREARESGDAPPSGKKAAKAADKSVPAAPAAAAPTPAAPAATGAQPADSTTVQQRNLSARVEEVDDD